MKRFFFALLAITIFAASAFADDNVRAVQTKLKQGGLYFGQVDGAMSSDLSAAITRYQIRNGLQITGRLDAETAKGLGVNAEVEPATAAPNSETWRQLRKSNGQSHARTTAVKPATDNSGAVPDSPTKVMEPAADGSKVLLSRDRLRDYVAAFVLAGLDPQVGAELEFFADRVRYFNDGVVGPEKIRADLARYDARWPERRFWLAGEVNAAPQPDSRIRVSFPLRYDLRNGSKHASGRIRKTLVLEVRGEDLLIVGVDETKA